MIGQELPPGVTSDHCPGGSLSDEQLPLLQKQLLAEGVLTARDMTRARRTARSGDVDLVHTAEYLTR